MPGALAGVASCARCGSMQTTAGVLCQSCGTALTPAARGSVLGTYTPLIAGVARTNALRGYLAALIDALPLAVAAAVAVVAAASGAFGTVAWIGIFSGVFLGGQLLLFVRRGRTLGRLALSLRTVDDLTGNPVSIRKMHGALHALALDSAYGDRGSDPGTRPADPGAVAASRLGTGGGLAVGRRRLCRIGTGCRGPCDFRRSRDRLRHRTPPGDPDLLADRP